MILLHEKLSKTGVTEDRIHRLKREIPTRWHSRLGAMLTYITEVENIAKVAAEMSIDSSDWPTIIEEQKNLLAEFILVLAEVRRIARQLEADHKVKMSQVARLQRKLYETLLVMAGEVTVSSRMYHSTAGDDEIPENITLPMSQNSTTHPAVPSSANN